MTHYPDLNTIKQNIKESIDIISKNIDYLHKIDNLYVKDIISAPNVEYKRKVKLIEAPKIYKKDTYEYIRYEYIDRGSFIDMINEFAETHNIIDIQYENRTSDAGYQTLYAYILYEAMIVEGEEVE